MYNVSFIGLSPWTCSCQSSTGSKPRLTRNTYHTTYSNGVVVNVPGVYFEFVIHTYKMQVTYFAIRCLVRRHTLDPNRYPLTRLDKDFRRLADLENYFIIRYKPRIRDIATLRAPPPLALYPNVGLEYW